MQDRIDERYEKLARETAQIILDWLDENALWETQVGDFEGFEKRIKPALELAALERARNELLDVRAQLGRITAESLTTQAIFDCHIARLSSRLAELKDGK